MVSLKKKGEGLKKSSKITQAWTDLIRKLKF